MRLHLAAGRRQSLWEPSTVTRPAAWRWNTVRHWKSCLSPALAPQPPLATLTLSPVPVDRYSDWLILWLIVRHNSDSWEGVWLDQLFIIVSNWELLCINPSLDLQSACGLAALGSGTHLWSVPLWLTWSCGTDPVTDVCSLSECSRQHSCNVSDRLRRDSSRKIKFYEIIGYFNENISLFLLSLWSNSHKAKNSNTLLSWNLWEII